VDDLVSLPLLPQPGLVLVPGQTLPLHLFHPSLVSMMRAVLASPSKAFGVVGLGAEAAVRQTAVRGTVAEVFEVHREEEEVAVGSPPGRPELGLKLKARGGARFLLLAASRQADGNLVGQVRILLPLLLLILILLLILLILLLLQLLFLHLLLLLQVRLLPEVKLGDPLQEVRLRSQDRVTARGGGGYRRGMGRWLSPHPPWAWDLYDPALLAARVRTELGRLGLGGETELGKLGAQVLPGGPAELSWWVTTIHYLCTTRS
jgi:hypothetical protein